MLEFLAGWKTYILSAGTILTALGGYLDGAITLPALIGAALAALGVSTLRSGIKTETVKAVAVTNGMSVGAAKAAVDSKKP